MSEHVSDSAEWQTLQGHAEKFSSVHLRDLFGSDPQPRAAADRPGRPTCTSTTARTWSPTRSWRRCSALAERAGLHDRIAAMFAGEHINTTEDRAVLHTALRLPRDATLVVDGQDVVAEVHEVLDRMGAFADRVRSGEWTGAHRATRSAPWSTSASAVPTSAR